jgi:serine O-acetyltransferase
MISAAQTREHLRADRVRLRAMLADDPVRSAGPLLLEPSYQAVWLHRWSHYFFARGNRLFARLLWHLNVFTTTADISPISRLGAGLVVLCPVSVIIVGEAGRDLTVSAHAVIGGGLSRRDIGAGPGMARIGDGVVMETGAMVLGPIVVGARTVIRAQAVLTSSVPEDSVIETALIYSRKVNESAGIKRAVGMR